MPAPFSSTLNDPSVQNALQALADTPAPQLPEAQGAGSGPASAFSNAKVQQALQTLGQEQP